jgi:hypothetical protein
VPYRVDVTRAGDAALDAFAVRQLARPGDHPSIDIDPQRIADGGHQRRLSCCLARPAADVQHTVCRSDAQCRPELLVVELELGVVVDHGASAWVSISATSRR